MEQLVSALSHQALEVPRLIHTVVIFINSGSGGKEGHQLMDTGVLKLLFRIKENNLTKYFQHICMYSKSMMNLREIWA
jgi:hypothetical protein